MREPFSVAALVATVLVSSGVAAPVNATSGACRVIQAEKLQTSISSDMICAKVDRAIALRAPGVRYDLQIKVLSASRLAATLVVQGKTLPVQNFAVMDRDLSEGSIEHFANSLATVVAAAAKP
jgi:hypothetical protein